MEARSSNHGDDQLELDPGSDGSVRVIDDRLVIDGLTVEDERAAQLVRERAASGVLATETVRKVIEVGARILEAEGAAVNVDYVKREVQATVGELHREMAKTLEGGSAELAEHIAAAFGSDRADSVQSQIQKLLEQAQSRQHLELTKLLGSEDPANPLFAVGARMRERLLESDKRHSDEMQKIRKQHADESRALQARVGELSERLSQLLEVQGAAERLAEAEAAGTRKGFSFEERVHDALEAVAAARGDLARHTGATANEAGSKKGDSVVEIGAADGPAQGAIVFEAKDKRLSKQAAWQELDAALTDRGADYAILVVAGEENVPAGREPLHEYEGNKMIVAVDREDPAGLALELAYRYARARTLMSAEAALTVDAAGVRVAAEAARTQLKDLNKARRSLTAIESGAGDVREVINGIDKRVCDQLDRIESLIALAGDADDG